MNDYNSDFTTTVFEKSRKEQLCPKRNLKKWISKFLSRKLCSRLHKPNLKILSDVSYNFTVVRPTINMINSAKVIHLAQPIQPRDLQTSLEIVYRSRFHYVIDFLNILRDCQTHRTNKKSPKMFSSVVVRWYIFEQIFI